MKLFYYIREDGIENFGDSLNPWLWNQLIPEALDDDETTAFVGIGTIVNGHLPYRLPNTRDFVVFSSGLGYCLGTIPAIDDHWKIYCVRGALSARQLGLPEEFAIADGALLIRRVYTETATKKYPYSFMPHVQQAIEQGELWVEVCQQAGVHYLDPCRPIADILHTLNETEVLLTEAMHGAIAAEALRVPWIPIRTNPEIFTFKWVDWCDSVGLEYHPCDLPISSIGQPDLANQTSTLTPKIISERREDSITDRLKEIIQTTKPILAKDHHIETLTNRLEAKLEQFKSDVKAGSVFHRIAAPFSC